MGSIEKLLSTVKISELPRRPVCTVSPSTSLGEVYRLLDEEHSVAVLVCEGTDLVGIFTERDIVNRTALEGDSETPIGELMNPVQGSLGPEDRLADAIAIMHERGYRHVPLVGAKGEKPGLIGGRDILKLIAECHPQTLLNLPPRLDQRMNTPEGG